MDPTTFQPSARAIWGLVAHQHGVVARRQLLALGCSVEWIKHRIENGRLHPVHRGVYAVGRPQLTKEGEWMSAVLACGPSAALSHASAAALWGIAGERGKGISVSVPAGVCRVRPGIVVHRRAWLEAVETRRHGIPVTTVIATLVDLAAGISRDRLEAAINEADKLGLVTPTALRAALDDLTARPGLCRLREILDRETFTLTDSQLERRFLPLARRAGLRAPAHRRRKVNGFEVDFFWPELGLVVETDGLRYHRTAAQQARDRVRDQVHTAAGLTPLRFTHAQVRFESAHVEAVLATVVERLQAGR
jgi:very-short-patch-repair endonuclease